MPEVNYALGGSMAVYEVRGRFGPKYSVTGDVGPIARSGVTIPNWKIGAGAISGAGEFDVDYSFSDDTDKSTVGQIVGIGSPVASGTSIAANSGTIVGQGAPAVSYTPAHAGDDDVTGAGDVAVSGTSSEGHDITIVGSGALEGSVTTTRNVTGEAEAVGDTAADGTEDPGKTFLEMIQAASADSGLVMCLDAAALGSYPGSGQTFTDLSGNGNNFYRGANSTSEARDPTFNGTAGSLTENEYFSLDGGDYFNDTLSQSWADDWHKNNAEWTLVGVDLIKSSMDPNPLFSSYQATTFDTNRGIDIVVSINPSNGNMSFVMRSMSGSSTALTANPLSTPAYSFSDMLVFWAVAIDESAGASGGFMRWNELTGTFTATYSSPSSLDPPGTYNFGRRVTVGVGSVTIYAASGSRLYTRAAWNRKLSSTEIANIYAQLQSRYSALP